MAHIRDPRVCTLVKLSWTGYLGNWESNLGTFGMYTARAQYRWTAGKLSQFGYSGVELANVFDWILGDLWNPILKRNYSNPFNLYQTSFIIKKMFSQDGNGSHYFFPFEKLSFAAGQRAQKLKNRMTVLWHIWYSFKKEKCSIDLNFFIDKINFILF